MIIIICVCASISTDISDHIYVASPPDAAASRVILWQVAASEGAALMPRFH